jgi:hypothetical protein
MHGAWIAPLGSLSHCRKVAILTGSAASNKVRCVYIVGQMRVRGPKMEVKDEGRMLPPAWRPGTRPSLFFPGTGGFGTTIAIFEKCPKTHRSNVASLSRILSTRYEESSGALLEVPHWVYLTPRLGMAQEVKQERQEKYLTS